LIEIGRGSASTAATKRIAEALGGMGFLLGLVWIIRGILGIQQYSYDILVASFGLVFLSRLFMTKTNAGAARAVSTFLWNIAATAIFVVVGIWFFGWVASIQADVLPAAISSRVPTLVIVAIVAGLGAYAASKFYPGRRKAVPSRPAFLVGAGTGPASMGTRVTAKRDTVGLTIKRDGRTLGAVLLGDITASFETPMGPVNASLTGPVTTVGVPFQGKVLGKTDVVKLTGRTQEQLVAEIRADTSVWNPSRTEGFDLPFVYMWKDDFESEAHIGPLEMRQGPAGQQVKIGPVTFDAEDKRENKKWLAKGAGESYIRTEGSRISAKWNGSSLSMEGGAMKLSVGSDGFSYSPTEVRASSPLHSLQVTKDKITLDTRKFTLQVSGDKVVLRTEDKTNSTESKDFANDLRSLLTETVERQVKDVMEGTPIDLSEMLATTEEVLAKHG
jgi:hypothetical protein